MTYEVDLLIPTARFVFSVEGDAVDVLPEHRSPEAFVEYREVRERRPVVGMTTFPNTVLLRGPRTILVDPGLPLQNDPALRALEARGLSAADVDLVVLTHAHLDHAGGCASVLAPVAVHELETSSAYWPLVGGLLELLPLELLTGDAGELAPGVEWALTPGTLRRAHQPGRRHRRGAGRPVRRHHRSGQGRVRRHGAVRTGRRDRPGLVAAHPRLGPGARHRRAPAAVRSLRPAARRSVPRPACATLRPLVTTPGRLLRAYL